MASADCDESTLAVLATDTEDETDDDGLCAGDRESAAVELTVEESDGDEDGSGVAEVDAEDVTTLTVAVASIVCVGLLEEDGVSLADAL